METTLPFAAPLWLLAAVPAWAALFWLFRRNDKRRQRDLALISHPRFRHALAAGSSLPRFLWLASAALLFIALARPQWGHELREARRRGIDILFAVDVSRSMLAEDLTPNRLERARMGILDFVARLNGDRIGLIPFAGSAYALCPLTLDYDAFRTSLDVLNTDLIPHPGTDLASAIAEAERMFKENPNNQRILVLITDGEDLQGDVIDAAKESAKNGLIIHTVGVGSPSGATIPIRHQNGHTDLLRDDSGQPVTTKLDEDMLKKIAETSKAIYVPLGRGAEGLHTIYQEKLRLMPKNEQKQSMQKIPHERYQWPLAAAIILLLTAHFMPQRTKRFAPGTPSPSLASNPQITTLPIIILFLLTIPQLLPAATPRELYNQGTASYESGDFTSANQQLAAALRTDDLTLQHLSYYNLGNSHYRLGQQSQQQDPKATIEQWRKSLKAYQDALALNPEDADALFNKELVEKKLKQLEQQNPQQDQSQQDQKDQQDQQQQDEQKKQEQEQQQQQDQQKQQQQQANENKQGEQKPGEEQSSQQANDTKEKQEGKEGEESQAAQQNKDGKELGKEGEQQATAMQPRAMSAEEAKQLIEALRSEQSTAIPMPMKFREMRKSNTNGKTW